MRVTTNRESLELVTDDGTRELGVMTTVELAVKVASLLNDDLESLKDVRDECRDAEADFDKWFGSLV